MNNKMKLYYMGTKLDPEKSFENVKYNVKIMNTNTNITSHI